LAGETEVRAAAAVLLLLGFNLSPPHEGIALPVWRSYANFTKDMVIIDYSLGLY
jgi:hypothetical protein